jgi:thiaminase (transcriptional activator TenA)
MSAQKFSETLRVSAAPIWRKELAHPFVRGLADGTLRIERFQFYLRQDYVFLIDYCRVFALGAAKARALDTMAMFAKLLHETLHTEMELHRDYCRRLGIPREELERTAAAPVTHAYTRHLLDVAWSGSLAEIVAAVLPCQLGYAKIATTLVREQPNWQSSPYAEWIRTYASVEFIAGAEKLRELLDTMTSQWPEVLRQPLEENFLASSRYEYLFWEMAWNQAEWPV